MKKLLLIVLIFLFNINIWTAWNLEVKSNIESWEYSFPIEVNLISNDKEAKIFYYTDWEWRMDHIKEFKNPIIIKENTNIDFYATSKDYESTLIQTVNYTFSYPKEIEITWKNDKIIIKNNSQDVQNIWYWQVQAQNLDYEINPNTYLEIWKTFEIDYKLSNNEKISLISPDKKIIKNFTYKIEQKTEKSQNEIWTWNTLNNEEKVVNPDENKPKNETWEYIETWKILKNNETKNDFSLNNSLKTSVIESKNSTKENKSNNLYIIFFIFFIVIIYNIWLLLKKSEKFKELKTKINKFSKK